MKTLEELRAEVKQRVINWLKTELPNLIEYPVSEETEKIVEECAEDFMVKMERHMDIYVIEGEVNG